MGISVGSEVGTSGNAACEDASSVEDSLKTKSLETGI
jgi:hypothetical protein